MAVFKRNRIWWSDFSVNGQRYRQSLRTSDWRRAQAMEKELIAKASAGTLTPSSQRLTRLPFSQTLYRYLEDRAVRVCERSARSERDHSKPLEHYFGPMPLGQISVEDVLAYIRERKASGRSNTTINMETGILRSEERRVGKECSARKS